jgi:hypothetical protein
MAIELEFVSRCAPDPLWSLAGSPDRASGGEFGADHRALRAWTTAAYAPVVGPFIRRRMIAAIEQFGQALASQDH